MSRRRYRRSRGRRNARALLPVVAVFAALAAVWLGGMVWFANAIPDEAETDDRVTDAIVVLTGGSDRLAEGLKLLASGLARKLFVSGVYRGVEVRELLHLARREPSEIECCVVLGYSADNTKGNARETAIWLEREGFHSLRLVTASYHMPRSLLEFRRAMPAAEIVPHPVFPDRFKQSEWWRWPGTAALIAREYNKYLLALVRAPFRNGADASP